MSLFTASQAAMEGKNPIIIDNTNSQMWEMKVYAKQVSEYMSQNNY